MQFLRRSTLIMMMLVFFLETFLPAIYLFIYVLLMFKVRSFIFKYLVIFLLILYQFLQRIHLHIDKFITI